METVAETPRAKIDFIKLEHVLTCTTQCLFYEHVLPLFEPDDLVAYWFADFPTPEYYITSIGRLMKEYKGMFADMSLGPRETYPWTEENIKKIQLQIFDQTNYMCFATVSQMKRKHAGSEYFGGYVALVGGYNDISHGLEVLNILYQPKLGPKPAPKIIAT